MSIRSRARTDTDGLPTFFHRTAPLSQSGNLIIPQCPDLPWVTGFAHSASMSWVFGSLIGVSPIPCRDLGDKSYSVHLYLPVMANLGFDCG